MLIRAAALLASLVVTACGGASSTVPLSTPVLTVTPQAPNTLRFSWPDVARETGYRLLEDPDGASGFTVLASLPADTTRHDLAAFLPDRVNARYILQACDARGCINSPAATLTTALDNTVGYVKASNTTAGATFGYAMALSADGSTLAVGALSEDSHATGIDGDQNDQGAPDSGAVYVFTLLDSGAAYVFTRSGSTWSQQAYVKASAPGTSHLFGHSVALSASGDTLAVGVRQDHSGATGINGDPHNDDQVASGAVYVFARGGSTWSQQAYVKASNTGESDRFGSVVALSSDGHTLAVGAELEDSSATGIDGAQNDESVTNSGAAYVFTRTGSTWSQQAYVKASNTGNNDRFGTSIALSADGRTLAVGADGESSGATGVNGDQADNARSSSGAVYVFTHGGTAWSQQAYVKASYTSVQDRFGGNLALSADGDTLAVGASAESGTATGINGNPSALSTDFVGAAYVFRRASGGGWGQRAYVKASNTGPSDYFGAAIALSADGATLAAGAPGEASGATGIGGNQADNSRNHAGAVYLY